MKRGTNGYYHILYKTTNLINDRFYVGIHSTRILEDGYLGSGKRISYEIKKHGKENFKREILEFCKDRISLALKEKEIVTEELRSNMLCLNLANGGEAFDGVNSNKDEKYYKIRALTGGNTFKKLWKDEQFSENVKNKSSKTLKKLHNEGKIRYDTFKGRTHSLETKQKISETHKLKGVQQGERNSQFGTCWITHELIGSRKCNKELLPEYLEQGWYKGRKVSCGPPDLAW